MFEFAIEKFAAMTREGDARVYKGEGEASGDGARQTECRFGFSFLLRTGISAVSALPRCSEQLEGISGSHRREAAPYCALGC